MRGYFISLRNCFNVVLCLELVKKFVVGWFLIYFSDLSSSPALNNRNVYQNVCKYENLNINLTIVSMIYSCQSFSRFLHLISLQFSAFGHEWNSICSIEFGINYDIIFTNIKSLFLMVGKAHFNIPSLISGSMVSIGQTDIRLSSY